jgi:hypothetical protein
MKMKHEACRTHCCIIHGCKYGHEDCPVIIGKIKQEHICIDCYDNLPYNTPYRQEAFNRTEKKISELFFKSKYRRIEKLKKLEKL